MPFLSQRRYALLCATAACGLAAAQSATAQTDDRIQSIERQIRLLQEQLSAVEAALAPRDRALRDAREQARPAREESAATAARVNAAPAAPPVAYTAPPPGPPLQKGQFRVGPLTVTLGGYAAAEGVYRSRNEAGTVATSFNGIPLPNSPNYHIPEYRESAQQSRFSLLTEARIDDAQKLTGYLETDFLSAGTSSNSNESNSYTLRLRQFWGNYDNSDWGLHILAGQAWSLATLYKVGLTPLQ